MVDRITSPTLRPVPTVNIIAPTVTTPRIHTPAVPAPGRSPAPSPHPPRFGSKDDVAIVEPGSIALLSGCFNPPTLSHCEVVSVCLRYFERVVIYPCATRYDRDRPDREGTSNNMCLSHRAALVDIGFARYARDYPNRVHIDLSGLETRARAEFRPEELMMKYPSSTPGGKHWIVVGMDVLEEHEGKSELIEYWPNGPELWKNANWAVFKRAGFTPPQEFPPHTMLFRAVDSQSFTSEMVRKLVYSHQAIDKAVLPEVAAYIESFMLYSGVPPPTRTPYSLVGYRALLYYDTNNPLACSTAERLREFEDKVNPNVVVVIGGDGTMLRAIRDLWRKRLPFFGINCGHLGHLLNDMKFCFPAKGGKCLAKQEGVAQHLPLVYVEMRTDDNTIKTGLAFNDLWLERSSGQCAWLTVKINGETKLPKLVGDGILVATAAGSTAYAFAMGASPLPVGVPLLCMVGNNVSQPGSIRPIYLPLDTTIEISSLDSVKRPIKAFVDGVDFGSVASLTARVSNIADCRIIFLESSDIFRKLASLQFPSS